MHATTDSNRRSFAPRRLAGLRAYVVAGMLSTVAVAAGSCADDSTPATPPSVQTPATPPVQTPPPTPPSPTFTISGIVIEYTATDDHHPAAGVLLSVLSEEAVTATSDASGRFTAEVRGDVMTIVPAATSPYLSPCPGGTDAVSSNPTRTFEVNIVSKDVLSTTGVPDSYPIASRTSSYVSGIIFERTPDGPHPLAGASVSLLPQWGVESGPGYSTTLSDALGRYAICEAPPGVGTDQFLPLRAAKDGYFADSLEVMGGWSYPWTVLILPTTITWDSSGVNLELRRKP